MAVELLAMGASGKHALKHIRQRDWSQSQQPALAIAECTEPFVFRDFVSRDELLSLNVKVAVRESSSALKCDMCHFGYALAISD